MTQITLLDGGMGQELVHRAGDKPTPLWATQVMLDQPELVADVHRDFAAAGATVATSNTYALHHDRFVDTPYGDQLPQLFEAALDTVHRAVGGHGRIAGSIGPLGASFRPDRHPDHATAVPHYAQAAQYLAPRVDLIICETVASVAHARAVLDAALPTGKPVWLSFTIDDTDGTRLRSGEPLADAMQASTGATAILVNCAAPEAVTTAMGILRTGSLPFGGYANGFTRITKAYLEDKSTVDSLTARTDLGPDSYARHAMGWIAEGATIVGGCCEVGPSHIARLAQAIRDAGHEIV